MTRPYPVPETLEGPLQSACPDPYSSPPGPAPLTWCVTVSAAVPLEAPTRPVAPWEVLDLGLTPILSCESWREVTAAVRRYPRRTQFIIRHWSPVGGKFHQADGLWMVWVSLGGVLHARAIRRHWPIDPR